ncbi:MAG TPA: GNAT family N-acetyltransferase [Acidimicrobiales bacterium]|nr:GNAT family N-acetyltransferase [Acidimicrobiales bacterium]
MEGLRIRNARLEDLDAPVVGGENGVYRESMLRHLERVKEYTSVLVVAVQDSQVLGRAFIELWGEPPGWWLGGLVVDEKHRGRGVGTALIRHAEWRAGSLGGSELFLSVGKENVHALQLYERLGYTRSGEDMSAGLILADGTVVHEREPVWLMRLDLLPRYGLGSAEEQTEGA